MLCAGKKSRFVQRDKVYAYIHTFNLTHHAPTSLFSRTRRDKMKIVEMLLNLFRCVDALNVVCGGVVPPPFSENVVTEKTPVATESHKLLESASDQFEQFAPIESAVDYEDVKTQSSSETMESVSASATEQEPSDTETAAVEEQEVTTAQVVAVVPVVTSTVTPPVSVVNAKSRIPAIPKPTLPRQITAKPRVMSTPRMSSLCAELG
eukprot:TRINITY_DN9683_c0_g1_i4.p1 TRINITY_DN9683_c0_g1~~TRINITY_DN9683_c0_g1_i4.p1  ORF type:complete len:207 (+),score=33.61 TRINITY_DN9683_c0_g1_i4:73-693(+)